MKRASKFEKRLRTENLESRCLLAGDIAAVLDGNVLDLQGDDEGNEIVISAALDTEGEAIANSFVVTGLNGTTINGEADATFEDVTHIEADLGDGDDIVQLTSAVVQGNVHVETGTGADQVWVGHFPGQATDIEVGTLAAAGVDAFLELEVPDLPVAAGAVGIARNLTIEMGDDDDVAAISDVLVRKDVTVATGAGNDQVFMLAMSDLEDDVALAASLLPVPLEIDLGRGIEVQGKLNIRLGDGADAVTLMNTSAAKGIVINDPQTDTDIALRDVDGGHKGIVINGPNGNGPFGGIFDRIRNFLEDLFNRFSNNSNNNGFGFGSRGGLFR